MTDTEMQAVKSELLPDRIPVLVVDDDQSVLDVTRLVLSRYRFDGHSVECITCNAASEARALLQQRNDIAVILLDVVMERDDAGLALVEFIRNTLGDRRLRIILRTGQAGFAPEYRVVQNYDINDYLAKTESTQERLFVSLTTALRGYRDIMMADFHARRAKEAEQEREVARASGLFFAGATAVSSTDASPTANSNAGQLVSRADAVGSAPAFLERPADRRTSALQQVAAAPTDAVLQAGSVIPAALITGVRSDQPGLVTAQVTQNVYDSLTERILLIPQGARLIGDYASDVGFGQRRVLLAWNRLILPDGRSLVLERQPATDPSGYAGLEDGVDYHWGGVVKATLVSTLLGIGSELGLGGDSDLVRALRRGSQDTVNRAGEQIVSRELDIRPTLTIRPGYPVRVLVTRDIIMEQVR